MHLRSEEVTIAELLQDAGYRTGHFGKWHLSRLESDQPGPLDQGFDYSLGTDNNASPNHHNPTNFIRNGEPTGKIEGYSCQIVVDEMQRWLTETQSPQSEKPFFACIWFHEPHTPIASPPDLVAKYQKLYPELSKKAATYHANIENVDRAVGRLLGKLDEMKLSENTLVHLTSDNGPLNDFSHQGLRGKKSNVWEGGHRVPGIYRWPGHIPAGSLSSVPISGVDFLPTICELTDIALPTHRAIDGTSILPVLTNSTQELERQTPLYWFFYRLNPAIGMRVGPWSLIANSTDSQRPKAHQLLREDMPHIRQSKPIQWQLFHLDRDLDQQQDLGAANPEILEKLKQQLDSLHRDVTSNGYQWNIPETYSKNRNRRLWNSK